jgi:sigma-B regulation protein RsbU (phosphoserine phosphatase)
MDGLRQNRAQDPMTLDTSSKGCEKTIQDVDPKSRGLREAEQKIRILHEITRAVSSFPELQSVLDAIVRLLIEEFKLDACSIRLLDSDGKLRIKSHEGLSKAFLEEAAREPTIESYTGDCFLTGGILIVNDADRMEKPISTNRTPCENIKSFAVAPIKVEEETIGVLVTSSKKRNYFHERFNDVIYVVSNQIGTAIRISRLYEEIHRLNQGLEQKVRERTAELEDKTRCLVEAERLATVGEMSNRMAHELRNSLTVVGGLARRLHGKSSDKDRDREYLKIIFEEVKTLEEKVSNLIKLGAGE